MFQMKVVERIKPHILCSVTVSRKSRRFWYSMGNYCGAREAKDHKIVRRMRFGCGITKATDTHSWYLMLISFPWHQWLLERPSVLRYTYIVWLVSLSEHSSSSVIRCIKWSEGRVNVTVQFVPREGTIHPHYKG